MVQSEGRVCARVHSLSADFSVWLADQSNLVTWGKTGHVPNWWWCSSARVSWSAHVWQTRLGRPTWIINFDGLENQIIPCLIAPYVNLETIEQRFFHLEFTRCLIKARQSFNVWADCQPLDRLTQVIKVCRTPPGIDWRHHRKLDTAFAPGDAVHWPYPELIEMRKLKMYWKSRKSANSRL